MKSTHFFMALALVALTACKVIDDPRHPHAVKDTPETVMVTYHVQAGKEAGFPALLAHAWGVYTHERLVRSSPHIIVQENDGDGKSKFVEIFTWVSHSAPNQALASVQGVWSQETAACEARDGHTPLEGGEVDLVVP